jgi:hypothetical protein
VKAHPRAIVLVVAIAVAATGCTSSSGDDDLTTKETTTTTTAEPRTPKVTPAALEGPITVGQLSGPADPRAVDLDAVGYVQDEFFASGTATAFTGDVDPSRDGRWHARPAGTAPYKTRFIVRRPKDPARFNGTVVVEWLNVTVVEAAPDWAYAGPAIVDDGAAWVGVSAQALTIEGGTSALQTDDSRQAQASGGLKRTNPERYGSLAHPGDAYAMDIYSRIGAALRSPGAVPVFGDGAQAPVRHVIAAGESQSASFLTGYINAIQPLADVYDGFFVHSRGSGASLVDGTRAVRGSATPYHFRTDIDAPVLAFETETDVGPLLRYGLARQDDTDALRVWEVPGTAHADAFLVGGQFTACPYPVNSGPQHWVATAALAALLRWVEHGDPPAHGPDIETTGDGTTIRRDARGNALGGIRTPSIAAPVATLSGEGEPGAPVLCALFGKTTPFDTATLKALYPTRDDYLKAFDGALDAVVAAGFVRRADRAAYAAEARAFDFPA